MGKHQANAKQHLMNPRNMWAETRTSGKPLGKLYRKQLLVSQRMNDGPKTLGKPSNNAFSGATLRCAKP